MSSKCAPIVLESGYGRCQDVVIHPVLASQLKSYQVDGIQFMYDSVVKSFDTSRRGGLPHGCILAHSMGLGKTFQTITLVHTLLSNNRILKSISNVLIVVPCNVLPNWSMEMEKWLKGGDEVICTFSVKIMNDLKTRLDRLNMLRNCWGPGKPSVVLISYEVFRSLSGQSLFDAHLTDPGPHLLICDEAHILNNECKGIYQALNKVKTMRRICLTGTPMQNNLLELYAMVEFVKPGFLGDKSTFRKEFCETITTGQTTDASVRRVEEKKKKCFQLFFRLSEVLQRKDKTFLNGIKKVEVVIKVKLTQKQLNLYEAYLDMIEKIQERKLLRDYHILSKICTHPYLLPLCYGTPTDSYSESSSEKSVSLDEEDWWSQYVGEADKFVLEHSNKFVLLFEILKECEKIGDKLLVFSQSIKTLHFIELCLHEVAAAQKELRGCVWQRNADYFIVEGKTKYEERYNIQESFNDVKNKRARLLLISTKAGGLGSNLIGANRVVLFDPSWNPAVDNQSLSRVHRIGQVKEVFVYRLIAFGAMEDVVYSRQITKDCVSRQVIDGACLSRNFTKNSLRELYSHVNLGDDCKDLDNFHGDQVLSSVLKKCSHLFAGVPVFHDKFFQTSESEKLSEAQCNSLLDSILNGSLDFQDDLDDLRLEATVIKNGVKIHRSLDRVVENDSSFELALIEGFNREQATLITYIKLITRIIFQSLPYDLRGAVRNIDIHISAILQNSTVPQDNRTLLVWHLFNNLKSVFSMNPRAAILCSRYDSF